MVELNLTYLRSMNPKQVIPWL